MFKHVIENGDIRTLFSISEYFESLQELEKLAVKGSLLKNMKSRLFNCFGNEIDVLIPSDKKEFLYCPKSV